MNWGTIVQTVSEDTRSRISPDRVKRFACDAMRLHKEKRLWFRDGTAVIPLRSGVGDYEFGVDIPHRVHEIIGDVVWVTYSNDTNDRYPVYRAPREEVSNLRAYDDDSGDPVRWDILGDRLRIWPTTDVDGMTMSFDYVEDVSVPSYAYEAAAWVFKDEHGVAITDEWSNSWLRQDEGFLMTKYRVLNLCFKDLGDQDQAALNYALWAQSKSTLEAVTENYEAQDFVEPRFF